MKILKQRKRWFGYLACALMIASPLASASADVISERKANFKQSAGALRAMRGQIGNEDFAAIAASADRIAKWAAQIPDYFPEGSGEGKTSARPEIWQEFADFTMLAKNHEDAAIALKQAAMANDGAAVGALAQKLGATCGACHSRFKY